MLAGPDIEWRLPVWHAFSDLFLDTELQAEDYRRIAAILRASGRPPAELRAILADEVAPAFMGNLVGVAGEWTSWSEAEVRAIMLRSLQRSWSPLPWLMKRASRPLVADAWSRIEPLLNSGTVW